MAWRNAKKEYLAENCCSCVYFGKGRNHLDFALERAVVFSYVAASPAIILLRQVDPDFGALVRRSPRYSIFRRALEQMQKGEGQTIHVCPSTQAVVGKRGNGKKLKIKLGIITTHSLPSNQRQAQDQSRATSRI